LAKAPASILPNYYDDYRRAHSLRRGNADAGRFSLGVREHIGTFALCHYASFNLGRGKPAVNSTAAATAGSSGNANRRHPYLRNYLRRGLVWDQNVLERRNNLRRLSTGRVGRLQYSPFGKELDGIDGRDGNWPALAQVAMLFYANDSEGAQSGNTNLPAAFQFLADDRTQSIEEALRIRLGKFRRSSQPLGQALFPRGRRELGAQRSGDSEDEPDSTEENTESRPGLRAHGVFLSGPLWPHFLSSDVRPFVLSAKRGQISPV
jgi:hypothetical protein